MFAHFKQAVRTLSKSPGFTLVAVFTLALGIGATVAIFSMVNTVLLRPLPYAQPERLARIYTEFTDLGESGTRFWTSNAEYLDIRREARSWESIDAWTTVGVNMAAAGDPKRITASLITGGLLPSLGIQAAMGRLITPRDDEPGAAPVAVISHGLWQRAFNGDRAIVGRDILLNGRTHTVVGIMPGRFSFPLNEPDTADLWAPLQIDPANPGERSNHLLNLLGKLKPNVTLHQAQAELASITERLSEIGAGHRFDPKSHPLLAYDFHEEIIRSVRPALQMLFGAVCFLLLIACVNVANLLLARAESRQREIAIRGALGASAWQLALQFVAEGLAVAGAGAALGLLLAHGALKFIAAAGAIDIPLSGNIGIDRQVMLFAVGIGLLTGLIFGLAPLFHVLRRNLHDGMKASSASTTEAGGTQRFRQLLIVAQLALALMLLAGTGLMMRAFWKVQQVDAGFDTRNVMTMQVALPNSVYSGEASRDVWTKLQQRLETLPGVDSVALMSGLPVRSPNYTTTMVEGYTTKDGSFPTIDFYQVANQHYFQALKIRLIAGRLFDERDATDTSRSIIVNQTFAQMYWGQEDPIGRRIQPALTDGWYTVVGVVADTKSAGLSKPSGSELYLPYTQVPANWLYSLYLGNINIAIRTRQSGASIVNLVRREVHALDATLPLAKVQSLADVVASTQARPRFLMLVLSLFAGAALLLAAVGIYGVISYSVTQRTKEFGLRMALGAPPSNVLNLVLRRGFLLTACGIAIGLAGSFAATRLLSSFLFGVSATDPATFAVVALLLGGVALLASYLPARRATRVDPLIALRSE